MDKSDINDISNKLFKSFDSNYCDKLELIKDKTEYDKNCCDICREIGTLSPKDGVMVCTKCGTENDIDIDNFIQLNQDEKIKKLKTKFEDKRKDRISKVGDEVNKDIEKKIFLQNLDFEWRSHLQYLEQLRQVIGLRGYGQKNPIDEYKRESFNLFQQLLEKIKENIVIFLSNIEVTIAEQMQKELSKDVSKVSRPEGCLLENSDKNKISRNEKCPATGKKFKSCCGSLV